MDPIYEIELQDCPYCRGTGTVEDEQGWCVYGKLVATFEDFFYN